MKPPYKIEFFFFLLFMSIMTSLHAQYYLTGQDPASVKWQQIKTDDIQLVFPKAYNRVAWYYMNILETTNPYVRKPYLKKQPRLTIILHNESTTSNAMVSPAPFHADFFDIPSQKTYPQIWQKQLALHEYRHAVQMSKMRQGFGKFLYYLMGEQGTAGLFGTFLPFWFIEGDAVFSETIHSRSGRGRMPDFIYPLQAQVLDYKIYPYDKALFGSYRNFVPDHYTLGYQLVLRGVEQHGTGLWNDVLDRVARKPFTLIPFTHGLKMNTGKGKLRFYKSSLNDLQQKWKQQLKNNQSDTAGLFIQKQKFYTNYLYLQALSSGKFIAEKTGIDDVNRFVMLDEHGNEKSLFVPGFDFESSLSANDSLICWNEKTFDPRWSNRDFSVIKIYNYKTKELRQLNHRSRYFAPSLSPDGKKVVAVRVDLAGNYFLDFLSSRDGRLIKSFKTSENYFFMQPSWSADGKNVVVIVLGEKGKSILLLNYNDLKYHLLFPFSYDELSHPALYGSWMVYSATYEGKDNLYVLNNQNNQVYRLFNARYGAKAASFSTNGKAVCFSNYTANGFKPAIIAFHAESLRAFNLGQHHFEYPIDKLLTSKTFILDDTVVPHKQYRIKQYSRLGHLFNPYSWGPLSIDADNYTFRPGITLLSQNKLSTAVSTLAYLRDMNEKTGKMQYNFDYYGWYPVIGVNISYGNRRIFSDGQNGERKELRWKETDLNLTVKMPLNFSKGKWIRGIQPSVSYNAKFLQTFPDANFQFRENRMYFITYQMFAYNQIKRSKKDIYPQWGQSLHLLYRHSPFSVSPSQQFALQAWLYFPGFARHQSLRLYCGYQQQQEGNYHFSNVIMIPRGYKDLNSGRLSSIKIDYTLAVMYPDLDWQGVAYLKRLHTHFFYDYLQSDHTVVSRSAGLELYSDWHFLSLFPEVSLGVRWSYTKEKNNIFEFLYSLNF